MKQKHLQIWEIALYSMLGTMTFSAQVAMEVFPNIHLTGMFVILFSAVFGRKALVPIYVYVLLVGVRWGFSLSWIPYLYIWLPLWGGTLLVSRIRKKPLRVALYCAVGCLHGLSFGILYAPAQALLFGFNAKQTLAWIGAGFVWDVVHGMGNLFFCTLVEPLSQVLRRLLSRTGRQREK